MKILYPQMILKDLWNIDLNNLERKPHRYCLRCGHQLRKSLIENPLSRHIGVHICPRCGEDEALRDFTHDPLHLKQWYAIREGWHERLSYSEEHLIAPSCTFKDIFCKPMREKYLYSKSDFDGYKWWHRWLTCNDIEPISQMTDEWNEFNNGLFRLDEFKTLDDMSTLCNSAAEVTSDPTEFNLYAKTDHFYIWIRLITRSGDNNVYVNYYLK